MASVVSRLHKKGLINPPDWLPVNIHYEAVIGSVAYGVSEDFSDMDVYGFCIPKKDMIFPHLRGEIPGFGRQIKRFEQYQQHHINDKDVGKEYDLTIYNIVKYFQLCMDNNPNMIDSLFVPDNCVLSITRIGNIVRENRKEFLHKGSWHKFKGYAYSSLHKAENRTHEGLDKLMTFERQNDIPHQVSLVDINKYLNEEPSHESLSKLTIGSVYEYKRLYERVLKSSSRAEKVKFTNGVDRKFLYHTVRLTSEVEQILTEGDLDLQRNREQLKAIRRGEMTHEECRQWFSSKEKELEKLYNTSKLQHSPDEDRIKSILLNCLEEHYGTLDNCIVDPGRAVQALREVQEVLNRNKNLL